MLKAFFGYFKSKSRKQHLNDCLSRYPFSSIIMKYDYYIKDFNKSLKLKGYKGIIYKISFLELSSQFLIATATSDDKFRLWDANTGKCIISINIYSRVNDIASFRDHFIIAYEDGMIEIYDALKRCLNARVRASDESIISIIVLENGTMISASRDGKIKVWEYLKCVMTYNVNSEILKMIEISDNQVAIKTNDNLLTVLDVSTKETHIIPTNTNIKKYTSDRIINISNEYLKIIDLHTFEEIAVLKSHGIICFKELPDDKIITGSTNKTLKIWDIKTGLCLQTFGGHSGFVNYIELLPDDTIVSVSFDSTIRFWNTNTEIMKIKDKGALIYVKLLPNGKLFTLGMNSNRTESIMKIRG